MQLITAMAKSYGITPVFVWQPVPTYQYDLQRHPFAKQGFADHSYSKYGYEHMEKFIVQQPLGKNFLWCATIHKNLSETLYVDLVHYSAKMCQLLADTIADLMLKRGLL